MNFESHAPKGLAEVSSDQLTSKLAELLHRERLGLVEFLWCLAEFDRRRLYEDLAYPTLFEYCTRALKLTKATAFRRTTSARLLARFPVAAEYLSDGRLCPTTFVLLRDVLTLENHRELLDRAAGKTEDEVKLLVVELRPRPEQEDSIRQLPVRTGPAVVPQRSAPAVEPAAPTLFAAPACVASPTLEGEPAPASTTPPPRPKIEPVTVTRTSIRMTVGQEFMSELAQVKAALSHVVPDGNLEAVLRICMQRTIELSAKRKHAATKARRTRASSFSPELAPASARPPSPERQVSGALIVACAVRQATVGSGLKPAPNRTAPPPDREGRVSGTLIVACAVRKATVSSGLKPAAKRSRYIPAEVRRAVWERDGGRCGFVAPDGRRCDSTHQLEFDHRDPHALGGEATVEAVRLRCRAHNLHWAREVFGAEHMDRFKREVPGGR